MAEILVVGSWNHKFLTTTLSKLPPNLIKLFFVLDTCSIAIGQAIGSNGTSRWTIVCASHEP
jgi:hypothetical protein